MREGQPLVDPRSRGQTLGIQLARAEHDLAVLPVDRVAVVVDRDEVVVGADLLDLAERVEKRLLVPERHVLERGGIRVDVRAREQRVTRELALRDAVEIERRARRVHVVDDVGRLAHLLVRRDDEALDDARVGDSADRDGSVQRDGRSERPERRHRHLVGRERRGSERGHEQQRERRHSRVNVGVARAVRDRRRRREQIGRPEPGGEGQHQEERGREQRDVHAGDARDEEAAHGIHAQVPGHGVRRDHAREGEQDQREPQVPQRLEEGKREDVEADVAPEQRVAASERLCVQKKKPGLPAARGEDREQERDAHRDRQDLRPERARIERDRAHSLGRHPHDVEPAQRPPGQVEVQEEDREREREHEREDREPRQDRTQHDLRLLHFLEPEPVGRDSDGRGQEQREQRDREHEWNRSRGSLCHGTSERVGNTTEAGL